MVQNFMGTIFRTKITTKNFFMSQSKKFVILSRKKKKVSKFFEKWQKMPKFLKFKCGFLAEIGRYFAEKWPIESGLPKIPTKIFFMTKSQKLVILSRKVDPPPPVFGQKRGGGRELYGTYPRYHLSWLISFTNVIFFNIKFGISDKLQNDY